jgi:hypothetical protein
MHFRLSARSSSRCVLLRSLALGSLLAAAGCSSSTDGASSGASASNIPGTPTAASGNIEVRSDVKQLDAATWDAMVMAHDGPHVWVKLDARGADWLTPGTVTVIKGRGVLKVGTVTDGGDHLVVERLPFDLGEFMENGKIAIEGTTIFETPFDDDASEFDVRGNASSMADAMTPPAGAGGVADAPPAAPGAATPQSHPLAVRPLGAGSLAKSLLDSVKGLAKDGWQVEKHISGDANALQYDVTITRDTGGLYAKLHAVGTLNDLQTAFSASVQNRVTAPESFDVHATGDADLTWEVGISENSVGYNKLVFPGVSYKQAFLVGDIPMVLKVKTDFAVIVGATGKNSTTTGKVHVHYASDGGVQITGDGGDSNATGNGDTSYADDKGTLTVGPSAFGFVATLPKVELGVGLDSLFVAGTYFSNNSTTIVKSQGGIAASPCANIDMTFTGTVGLFVDAGFAGKQLTKAVEKSGQSLSHKIYDVNRQAQTCGLK